MANTSALTRKMGPLPVWAWGILGGVAVYFLYVRYKSSSANSAVNSPVATTLDPSAVDPATGLTYGQEMAGGFPSAGGAQGAADAATGAPSLDNQLLDFATLVSDFSGLASQLGFTPPQPSDTTVGAAQSAPLDNTAPVATDGAPAATPITTHSGGPFYKFYHQMTGKNPPAVVSSSNPIYQLWKAGAKTVKTKNPTGHKQKTVHVANPGNHQHPVTKPKSTAKPVPVKRPAGGGTPGHPQSGSHQRVPTAPSRTGHPVARAPQHKPPKPPARRR